MPTKSAHKDPPTTARSELAFVRWELDRLAYMRLTTDVPSDRDRYRNLAAKERELIDDIRASEEPIFGRPAAGDGANASPQER
jgi:hypothetical protein